MPGPRIDVRPGHRVAQPALLLVFLTMLLAAVATRLALRLALRVRRVLHTRHFLRTSTARVRGRTAALDPRFPGSAWRAGVDGTLRLRAALDPGFPVDARRTGVDS